ncbi:MAG: response regulator, partial [Planctomycetota bacterium]
PRRHDPVSQLSDLTYRGGDRKTDGENWPDRGSPARQPNMSLDQPNRLIRTDERAAVLVIDTDPLMLTAMAAALDTQGYRAVMARTKEIAIDSIRSGDFDVIILAINELNSGCAFANELRQGERACDVPIIFLTPAGQSEWSTQLAAHGGTFSMESPGQPEELLELVEKSLVLPHLAKSKTGRGNSNLKRQSDWISLQ